MANSAAQPRIVTLDIVRGVAVMGILAMNIVAFSMPMAAYANPLAYGVDSALDFFVYGFSFIFIDGKMRGLFSFLFGASMLLVIQLAEQKGESPRKTIFRRQLWLLAFGLLHFYFIWFGDILTGYALIGMIAWLFRRKAPRTLIGWGVALLVVQTALFAVMTFMMAQLSAAVAAPNPDPEAVEMWKEFTKDLAVPSAAALAADLQLHRGPWLGLVEYKFTKQLLTPLVFTIVFLCETLAYMLFGMASLKSGFLTGEWDNRRYAKLALTCLPIAVPAYAIILSQLFAANFDVVSINLWAMTATVPFRPLLIVAYAALIILATRKGGWLVKRVAAAGRAAFTNYLGTSLLMTVLFYGWGFGLYGSLDRTQTWLVVIAMWAIMLAWSKPWLDRFSYGPFEWLWRSLARGKVQSLRKRTPERLGTPAEA